MSEYNADEPSSFDAIVERQPYEPAKESADPFSSGREGIQEAADEVSRARETRELPRQFVRDPDDPSSPAPRDVTITAETAADALRENRNLEARLEQEALDAATAREVDDFRGDVAPPAPEQTQPQELAPQAEIPPAEPTELDRMLAELPEHRRAPFVAAFNEMVSRAQYQAQTSYQEAVQQAQAVAQQYQQAAVQAIQVGEAVARQPFPELHNVPDAELPAVLGHIARTNPQRHAQIVGHVAQVKQALGQQLHAAQVIQHQRTQAQLQQQAAAQQRAAESFQRYAEREDAKIDKLLQAETPERRSALMQEAMAILRDDGLDDAQIEFMWKNDFTFRSATAQKMLMREAKSRIAERGVRAARVTPVQHVVRPGVSEPGSDRSAFAEVSREMRGRDLSVKDATRLLLARRSSR